MKNIFLILSLVVFFSCDKEENIGTKTNKNDRNWFEIKDEPGVFNQLRYNVFKDYDVSILINDTLGTEQRGNDRHGNPIYYSETIDLEYYIYHRFVLKYSFSKDEESFIKAAEVIKKWVCPYLPTVSKYKPRAIVLLDSLMVFEFGAHGSNLTRADLHYSKCLLGSTIGNISKLKHLDVDSYEWRRLAGLILSVKAVNWLKEIKEDALVAFFNLAAKTATTSYYSHWEIPRYFNQAEYNTPLSTSESMTFLNHEYEYLCVGEKPADALRWTYSRVTWPGTERDLMEYVAHYYIYKNRINEFNVKYQDYPKIVKKMSLLIPMMEDYEKEVGVKLN